MPTFHRISCRLCELRLDITLQCGQSFRWREIHPGIWRGVLGDRVWTLSQTDSHVNFSVHEPADTSGVDGWESLLQAHDAGINSTDLGTKTGSTTFGSQNVSKKTIKNKNDGIYEEILKKYFQLETSLESLYLHWSTADPNFAKVCGSFPGVRILNQDPMENVFSFICSSNNNIKRISSLVDKLCCQFGHHLQCLSGTDWFSFPHVSVLAKPGVSEILRNLAFGYRAKYIHQSAIMIQEKGGATYLEGLKLLPYRECHDQLKKLNGVGAKVADCICLMSMGHLGAIPVDTHVYQIAARDYLPQLRQTKTVTEKTYQQIGDHFRNMFGAQAGWAHSILFSADLKKFGNLKNIVDAVPKKKQKIK